ncbi:MAG: hypothetical protein J7K68_02410 [Candidatus Diapherotrites archaeon]|nr:hypothetical protein [Candidatus Diapherotrites archaeon]
MPFSKGQTATEFIMILAFILLLILPVAYIVYSQFSESSRVMQAQVAVDRLKRTADMVYYQAPGAKQFVTVSLPGGVDWTNSYIGKPGTANGTVLSKEISLKVYTRAGATEVWRSTKGEVKGYWPGAPGTYRYIVKKMDEGYVLIVPYEISFLLDPSSYSTNLQPGGSTSFTLNITNLESQAKTIDLDAGGDIATWISFSDDPVTLPADGSATSEVTITVPSNQAFGYYTSEVIATYENETAYVYIGVVVTGTGVGGAANVSTGMLLEILSPENTTYHDPLIPLIYWTNESTNWCGWSLNGGRFYTVSDNTTVLATKYGSNYLEMMCLSNEGDYGYDNVYFTSIYTTTCANRTVYSAIQDTLEDNTELVSESDDLRANMENTQKGVDHYLNATYHPNIDPSATIDSVIAYIEHYEEHISLAPSIYWWNGTQFVHVCDVPNADSDEIFSCVLSEVDTVSEVNDLLIQYYVTSTVAAPKSAFIDWLTVEICFSPGVDTTPPDVTIESPLNQTYYQDWVWMNVTLNENGSWCGYSLDGAANVTMNNDTATHFYYNASLNYGSHNVTFYCNDTSGNMNSTTQWFTTAATGCSDIILVAAEDSQGEDEGSDVNASDDIRADITEINKNAPQWLVMNFTGTAPNGVTIENATAYIEHYEGATIITPTLQWWDGTTWIDQCVLPNRDSDTIDSCSITNIDSVSEANDIRLRIYYTSTAAASRTAYVDYARVEVCYTV